MADTATADQVNLMRFNLRAFEQGAEKHQYRGMSGCRLCGKMNGSAEWEKNGVVIPTGLEHYILEHHVLVQELFDLKTNLPE